MNIAITTAEASLDSTIFASFAAAPWLLIVNAETMACTSVEHSQAPGSDVELARIVLEHDCEAVITGTLTEEAFALLADKHVTRYRAVDMSAGQAMAAMEARELEYIRNADGSDTCKSEQGSGLEDLRCPSDHTH